MCISAILAMIIGRHGGKIAYQTDGISERECGESLIVIDSSIVVNNQKKGYKIGEGDSNRESPFFFYAYVSLANQGRGNRTNGLLVRFQTLLIQLGQRNIDFS